MDRTDASLPAKHKCSEMDETPLPLDDYINPYFGFNPDITQWGDPQTSPKWKLDDSQIMDNEDSLEVF